MCCGTPMCWKIKHLLTCILLLLNTILLVWILCNQVGIEAKRVGGRDNYKMVQQIYRSPAFKEQQRQQIEQVLQVYQGGVTNITTPSTTTSTANTTESSVVAQ